MTDVCGVDGTVPMVEMNDDARIPQLGYGVIQIDQVDTVAAVSSALDVGYLLVDTAAYGNEAQVGEAVLGSGPRSTAPRGDRPRIFATVTGCARSGYPISRPISWPASSRTRGGRFGRPGRAAPVRPAGGPAPRARRARNRGGAREVDRPGCGALASTVGTVVIPKPVTRREFARTSMCSTSSSPRTRCASPKAWTSRTGGREGLDPETFEFPKDALHDTR